MNRFTFLATLLAVAFFSASCGRVPPEEASSESPSQTQQNRREGFSESETRNSIDVAGVIVTSAETVAPPVDPNDIDEPQPQENPSQPPGPANQESDSSQPATEVSEADDDRSTTGSLKTYTVKRGDVISTIAEKHGIRTSELAEANGLVKPYQINPGDELTIPG